jgi:serine/threonine protein kinase
LTIIAGTKLGRYEIRSKIGVGGMGEVYLALDSDLDRTVALKILPARVASEQRRLQRFIQEAKAASALNHPHILTIHEIGSQDPPARLSPSLSMGATSPPNTRRHKVTGLDLHSDTEYSRRHIMPVSLIATLNPKHHGPSRRLHKGARLQTCKTRRTKGLQPMPRPHASAINTDAGTGYGYGKLHVA